MSSVFQKIFKALRILSNEFKVIQRVMDKLRACIVGATGIVGQQLIVALQAHPWFKVSCLAASERSAGKTYFEALRDEKTKAVRWFCDEYPNENILHMQVNDVENIKLQELDVVFSAVEADVAQKLEPRFAAKIPVISTAATFRYDDDVPVLIPGVNSEHLKMIDRQRKRRGWEGFINTQPNCTTTGLVITIKPLLDRFGVTNVIMTSLQALSGAGRSPGVIGLDILDNVIPYIPREEEKVQTETLKILGQCTEGQSTPADMKVSCTCTRVNVLEGHTEAVFLSTDRECSEEEVKDALMNFGKDLYTLNLPSAPQKMIIVTDDPFRPQPRLDRNNEGGLATTVGRIRKDPVLKNGIKYVLVSHNTKMGAAKGAVLVAELITKADYL